jgi:hypothetical protein
LAHYGRVTCRSRFRWRAAHLFADEERRWCQRYAAARRPIKDSLRAHYLPDDIIRGQRSFLSRSSGSKDWWRRVSGALLLAAIGGMKLIIVVEKLILGEPGKSNIRLFYALISITADGTLLLLATSG